VNLVVVSKDITIQQDADLSRPRPGRGLNSEPLRPRGDRDFDLFERRRGDFLFLSRDVDRVVLALAEPDLPRRLGDTDLNLSFLRSERDLDL